MVALQSSLGKAREWAVLAEYQVSVCGKKNMERKRAAALAPAAHVG
jgi:hypothetical protein